MNFILYIVLGPGKFRQEFSFIFLNVCSCLNLGSSRGSNDLGRSRNRSMSFSAANNNLSKSFGQCDDSDNHSMALIGTAHSSHTGHRKTSNLSNLDIKQSCSFSNRSPSSARHSSSQRGSSLGDSTVSKEAQYV